MAEGGVSCESAVAAPDALAAAIDCFGRALAGFAPEVFSGEACAALAEQLATAEKLCAGARARAAARAGDCGIHRGKGFTSPEEWMARAAGISTVEARRQLETIAALGDCPATDAGLAGGGLSLQQAREITMTAAAVPGSEEELLEHAGRHSLRGLKERARKLRLQAMDPDELHRRQHREQRARHWLNELGQVCGSFALPPEVGIPIVNRWDTETDRLWRAGRAEGSTEPRDYYAAQALVGLLADGGRGHHLLADVVFVCDVRAYRRGHAHDGEPVHVMGGGPVPVSVVRDAVDSGAFIKAVTHDGVAIDTVVHYGRYIKTELRTALEVGDPPHFEGKACSEPGCDRRYGLQWDHLDPVANQGPTSRRNLNGKCLPHHAEKTSRDRQAGLLDNSIDRPRAGPP